MRYRYIGKAPCNYRDERTLVDGDIVDCDDEALVEQLDVHPDWEALAGNGDESEED